VTRHLLLSFFVVILFLLLTTAATAQQISGDYIETRSADVYTGQCFANGEVNLVGNEAILGWRIEKGQWDGVSLDGLTAVAVVRAKATLGDPYADPYPAKSVLIIDDRANPEQRKALSAFVKHAAGKLTENVDRVEIAMVRLELVPQHHGTALLRAGNFVTVQTRPINDHDHLCGNEETFYPPLTTLSHSMPAVALRDEYRGPGLADTWSFSGKRSAFVGQFSLATTSEVAQAGMTSVR
jgi:hypothetical protein